MNVAPGIFAYQAYSLRPSHNRKNSFCRDIRLRGFLFLVPQKWNACDLVLLENIKMVGNFLEASFFLVDLVRVNS